MANLTRLGSAHLVKIFHNDESISCWLLFLGWIPISNVWRIPIGKLVNLDITLDLMYCTVFYTKCIFGIPHSTKHPTMWFNHLSSFNTIIPNEPGCKMIPIRSFGLQSLASMWDGKTNRSPHPLIWLITQLTWSSISTVYRQGYRVNQPFIWEIVGWAPISLDLHQLSYEPFPGL